MRNKYDREDRILAYTMYRNEDLEIGLWDIKRIAQITGHSAASYSMKVDQFKGIKSIRRRIYVEDAASNKAPGLNEWAHADEDVVKEYQFTDLEQLNFLAKKILTEKFKTWNEYSEARGGK